MNVARRTEVERVVKLPRSLVCTSSSADAVTQIVRDLRSSGFSSDDVVVLSPEDSAARLGLLFGSSTASDGSRNPVHFPGVSGLARATARDPVVEGLVASLDGVSLLAPSIDVLRAELDAGNFVICVRVVDSFEVRSARSALDGRSCIEIDPRARTESSCSSH